MNANEVVDALRLCAQGHCRLCNFREAPTERPTTVCAQLKRSAADLIESLQAQLSASQPENELIVRCGNCKHYNRIGCADGFGWCERMDRGTNDDFYCSLAERSEG